MKKEFKHANKLIKNAIKNGTERLRNAKLKGEYAF